MLAGSRTGAGPHLIQQWLRQSDGGFVRAYAGTASVHSALLGAFWQPYRERRRLFISDDAAGQHGWLTGEQAACAEKEAERAEKEAALRRIAELEVELARSR
jgi:hypothetical protein